MCGGVCEAVKRTRRVRTICRVPEEVIRKLLPQRTSLARAGLFSVTAQVGGRELKGVPHPQRFSQGTCGSPTVYGEGEAAPSKGGETRLEERKGGARMARAAAAGYGTISVPSGGIGGKSSKASPAARCGAGSGRAFRAGEVSSEKTAYETAGSPPTIAARPATCVSGLKGGRAVLTAKGGLSASAPPNVGAAIEAAAATTSLTRLSRRPTRVQATCAKADGRIARSTEIAEALRAVATVTGRAPSARYARFVKAEPTAILEKNCILKGSNSPI